MIEIFPECPGFIGFDTFEELNEYEARMQANYTALMGLIPSLIQFAENIHGPKTGQQKLTTVLTLAQNAILVASQCGVIHPTVATNIVALTETVNKTVNDMKASGALEEAGK